MPCRRLQQVALVRNTGATTNTGTAVGRVRGLSSLLHVHVAVAFLADNKVRPSSFTGNTFDLLGLIETEDGRVQLDSSPINNNFAGDQQAPGGWEGTTALDEIQVDFAYTGLNAAGSAGKWVLVAKVEPAMPMDDDLFAALAEGVRVSVDKEQSV